MSSSIGSLSGAQVAQLAGNYKLTPTTLFSELNDWWIPAPFLQYLGAEIASAVARGSCGLLISAPPRHGKSKLITVATPLWVLENFPKKNVIVATYGEDLSTDFTREVKDNIKNHPDKLNVRIRRDVDRAQNFVTPQGGGLKAVGLRGTITGRGADVLIIDDYIKEPKEALNHTYLEGLKTWYATVSRTRLEPGAVVIIVATRWVAGDLHGHIERLEQRRPQGRHFYKIIKIPAISGKFDKDLKIWVQDPKLRDPIGRKPGDPLFPQRYTLEGLEDIRYELGNRWFMAMFQQDPQSEDTAIVDSNNFRYISKEDYLAKVLQKLGENPTRYKRRRSWDFASTKDAGDYTCGVLSTYDKLDEDFYIEHMHHGQWSAGRVEEIYTYCAGDEGDPREVEIIIEQEAGSAGKYLVKHFTDIAPHRKVRYILAAAEGSKLLKAQPFLAAMEKRKIWLVVDDPNDLQLTPWVQKLLDEFDVFPEGGHDDIVDACAGGYNDSTGKKGLAGAFGRTKASQDAQERFKQGEILDDTPRRSRTTFGRTRPNQKVQGQKVRIYNSSMTRWG